MNHHPAAFINAIAEEGTKAEAIEWLQKTWNEACELRVEIERLRAALKDCAFVAEHGEPVDGSNYGGPREWVMHRARRALAGTSGEQEKTG